MRLGGYGNNRILNLNGCDDPDCERCAIKERCRLREPVKPVGADLQDQGDEIRAHGMGVRL